MYVRVRTVDGKEEKLISISKTATVKDLKHEIEKELHVEADLQRLFFGGKQLEDCYTIYDYNIKLNDVIQLLKKITNIENEATSSKSVRKQKNISKPKLQTKSVEEQLIKKQPLKKQVIQENIEEKAESLYYKVNDAVDCLDKEHGVWFEAIVQEVVKEGEEILYNVLWEFDNEAIPFNVPETYIRPRSKHQIQFSQLSIGQKVMINYNIEEPEDIGLWYDFTVTEIKQDGKLTGVFHMGIDRELEMDNVIPKGQIYAIEAPKLLTERTTEDQEFMISNGIRRPVVPACQHCMDNPRRKCSECGCKVCAGKKNEDRILICDECQYGYHLECLKPPLMTVPEEDEWFCPECKNDETEIVKPGDKLKISKKKSINQNRKKEKSKKDWGNGMACVGARNMCTIVPKNHRGSIPGIEVGTSWYYRFQILETGVHRSQIGGIHGRESDCAYSIVVSGLYDESDYDKGDEFQYTGSGGRDLSGNKRTAKQSKDQQLTKMNKALALNCNAPFNNKTGATAKDWKGGIPVRVVRSSKAGKNKYAPEEGYRYDGIYKVVKYFPKKNEDGLIMWKYILRRDDPTPAPWTEKGKERIASLGLELEYPDGCKPKNNTLKTEPPLKKLKTTYTLEEELKNLIHNDKQNAKVWTDCMAALSDGKLAFQKCVLERFNCPCCLDIVYQPVTLPCAHNICLTCLIQTFNSHKLYSCPTCRHYLGKDYEVLVNEQLKAVLLQIYPGYESGRR